MAQRIIDFHTHAFPDELAPRAMRKLLEEAPDVRAYLDGTLSQLLDSMDKAGIEKSIVCCIATRPEQFDSIFQWCKQVRSERLIMFPSFHPLDPKWTDRMRQLKAEGFRGIKFHPFYQDFYVDEKRLFEIYEQVCREDLLVVMHTGYDIAFPRVRRADPERLVKIKQAFPELKFITTHLGAWEQWDEVRQSLIGRQIYMEISFALEYLEAGTAREMIMNHPEEYVLFGTDSPWTDQQETLSMLKNLQLPGKKMQRILSGNALRLLGLG
ncbi:MAG TPA: amidohydrolase family protein [Sedimentisphaerales bacterium]|nr:amidohydrolase family protein [Sedimentisphaerales bacterium]